MVCTEHWAWAATHRRPRSDRLYLIRPDQYVADSIPLNSNTIDASELRAALKDHQLLIE